MKYWTLGLLILSLNALSAEPDYWANFESKKSEERIAAIRAAQQDLIPKFDVPNNKDIPAAHPELKKEVKAKFLKALNDPDENVQAAAMEGYYFVFSREMPEVEEKALAGTTSKNDELRRTSVMALAQSRSKNPKVAAALLAALDDKVAVVRNNALCDIATNCPHDATLVAKLTKILKDDPDNRMPALQALMNFPELPADAMQAVLAFQPGNDWEKESWPELLPIFKSRLGPQRWQGGILARANPYATGRVWYDELKPLIGSVSRTLNISASGSIPTQYMPVKGIDATPIDIVWFPGGDRVMLVYRSQPDQVIEWDRQRYRQAAFEPQAIFIDPKQRAALPQDYELLNLGSKAEYLKRLDEQRAKKIPERRFILNEKGQEVTSWHQIENLEGQGVLHGAYETVNPATKAREIGNMTEGKPDGKIQEWDDAGTLIADGIWKDGKPVNGKCRDMSDPNRAVKEFKDGMMVKP